MNSGFKGKAANNYLNITSNTIDSFKGKSIEKNLLMKDSSTVSIDSKNFDLFQSTLNNNNTHTVNAIEYILNEIENICNTIFIVPSAQPKIIKMVKDLHNQLDYCFDLGESISNISKDYYSEVENIDNNFSKKSFSDDYYVSGIEKFDKKI